MCVYVYAYVCYFFIYDKVNRELFSAILRITYLQFLPNQAQQDGVKSDEKYPEMRGTEITDKNLCDIEKRVK